MTLFAEEDPIGVVIAVVGIVGAILFFSLMTYLFIRAKGALRRRTKALAEGRLPEAQEHFKGALLTSFTWVDEMKMLASSKDTFDKALDGIAGVYKAAGKSIDLTELQTLRREYKALHRNKKLCTNYRMREYTREGAAIVPKLEFDMRDAITSLPGV